MDSETIKAVTEIANGEQILNRHCSQVMYPHKLTEGEVARVLDSYIVYLFVDEANNEGNNGS